MYRPKISLPTSFYYAGLIVNFLGHAWNQRFFGGFYSFGIFSYVVVWHKRKLLLVSMEYWQFLHFHCKKKKKTSWDRGNFPLFHSCLSPSINFFYDLNSSSFAFLCIEFLGFPLSTIPDSCGFFFYCCVFFSFVTNIALPR